MDEIFSINQDFLDTVVIGRSDFSKSCGISKSEVNGEKMFNYCKSILEKSQEYGFNAAIGGSISVNSIDFINNLENLLDRLETRKIVFNMNDLNENYKEAIQKAIQFEYLYLKNKLSYYQTIVDEDSARFNDLKNRVDVEL